MLKFLLVYHYRPKSHDTMHKIFEVQLPLYYIHFEIVNFSRSFTGFSSLFKHFMDSILRWLIKKLLKLSFISSTVVSYFKQALKFD